MDENRGTKGLERTRGQEGDAWTMTLTIMTRTMALAIVCAARNCL